MATQVQFRRGTTADISTFIGADGEVVVDTTKKTCVVHDGVKIAGYPLLREDGSNSALNVGSLSSCALKFINDPNTGIISPGADQIALVTGGASRLSVDSSGSVTIPGNLLVSGAFTGTITLDNGSAAVPALRFTNDPDTGIYLSGTNEVAISTGGTQRLTTTTTEVTSTLPIIHPIGAAATPSLTFAGDTNTGIYSPGADQVAISTNGLRSLLIEADGTIVAGRPDANTAGLEIGRDATASRAAYIDLVGDTTYTDYALRIIRENTGANANTVFYHRGTGSLALTTQDAGNILFQTNNTERARIDSSGRLGLGTSSPQTGILDLTRNGTPGTISTYRQFRIGLDTNNNYSGFISYGAAASGGSSGLILESLDNGAASKTIINPNGGNVGIGTTSPNTLLHVAGNAIIGAADANPCSIELGQGATGNRTSYIDLVGDTTYTDYGLRFQREGGANGASIIVHRGTGDLAIKGTEANNIVFSTNDTERMRLDSSGRLGLGTSSPATAFEIQGNQPQITIDTTTTGYTALLFATNGVNDGGIYYNGTDDKMEFYTADTSGNPQVVIDSSGRLGLGTSSPTTTFDCRGVISTNDALYCYNSARDGLGIWYNPGGAGVNQLTARVNGGDRLTIDSSGNVGIGTTSPVSLLHVNAATGIVYATVGNGSGGTQIGVDSAGLSVLSAFANNAIRFGSSSGSTFSETMRLDSSGRLGLGTSSPGTRFDIASNFSYGTASSNVIRLGASYSGGTATSPSSLGAITWGNNDTASEHGRINVATINPSTSNNSRMEFWINNSGMSQAMTLTPTGLGIGTTNPVALLEPNGTVSITGGSGASSANGLHLYFDTATNTGNISAFNAGVDNRNLVLDGKTIGFTIAGSEKAKIDASGRLLVGTSSARGSWGITPFVQYEGAADSTYRAVSHTYNDNSVAGPLFYLSKSRGSTNGSNTIVQAGDELGQLIFAGADGTGLVSGAAIRGYVDGTPGAGDLPTRLVFSTAADGASSPTERMRITNAGNVTIGTDGTTTIYNQTSVTGAVIERAGAIQLARSGDQSLLINRISNDGDLVSFFQDGTFEGSISVSGTTVSYNGAHLSRWSQLPSGAERIEILRGSVLSNIDEMCEWGDEDNEQLNRMKVSDVEGDPNVSGVFQAWDDDDDTYTDDFYCAMTGDFIIRIAEGVTVQRGDLLMSAGDGTAKPQDDDIIRSKTIAKVTSNHIACTYDDGSYCVPCVLMAC